MRWYHNELSYRLSNLETERDATTEAALSRVLGLRLGGGYEQAGEVASPVQLLHLVARFQDAQEANTWVYQHMRALLQWLTKVPSTFLSAICRNLVQGRHTCTVAYPCSAVQLVLQAETDTHKGHVCAAGFAGQGSPLLQHGPEQALQQGLCGCQECCRCLCHGMAVSAQPSHIGILGSGLPSRMPCKLN